MFDRDCESRDPETRDLGEPALSPPRAGGRLRAYLRRLLTNWVADDPDPTYSTLDRCDGLGETPVGSPVPVSPEVSEHSSWAGRAVGGVRHAGV